MKKKITLEELEKRIESLERNIIVKPYPYQYIPPIMNIRCTCNTSLYPCPIHGFTIIEHTYC